jgi:hypothetical protein
VGATETRTKTAKIGQEGADRMKFQIFVSIHAVYPMLNGKSTHTREMFSKFVELDTEQYQTTDIQEVIRKIQETIKIAEFRMALESLTKQQIQSRGATIAKK